MKQVKTDKNYKYYELGEKDQDESCYWEYEVVAISKEDLKYMSAKDCLMDGFVKGCECEYKKKENSFSMFGDWVVDKDTIQIVEE